MLWAALVAGGVAIVSMAIFGARLTRREEQDPHDDFLPSQDGADTDDPWAAWRPRPFQELDHRPRPRLWPVLTSLTGLVLVGGGLAGARQTITGGEQAAAETTSPPFLIEVKVTPTPTPFRTATPATPKPATTANPQVAATKAAAPTGGPVIEGSASCSEGKASVHFVVTTPGAALTWVGVYLDGSVIGGGPISSTRYESTTERTATPGDHQLEVSAQDKSGKSSRRQWRVHCP